MGSLQHDQRHQCIPQITFLLYLKPHLGNSTSGIAIPVTIARDTPGYRRDHILYACNNGPLGAHMFHHIE